MVFVRSGLMEHLLFCSVLAARVEGKEVTTLEGLQEEAAEFGAFLAAEGGRAVWILPAWIYYECNLRWCEELEDPTLKKREYLAGNLCRCGRIWDNSAQSRNI